MALFGSDVSDHFRDLPDGRTLFLPTGPRGPAYEIRDLGARERIERWYKGLSVVKTAITIAIVPVVFGNVGRWWWALGLMVPYIVEWTISRSAIDGLNEVHDFRILEEERERKRTSKWERECQPERWESSGSSPSSPRLAARRARTRLFRRGPSSFTPDV